MKHTSNWIVKLGLLCSLLTPNLSHADMFGGDIPLLIQIVSNTLGTLKQMQHQSSLLKSELRGIEDKIHRIEAIKDVLSPRDKEVWRNPLEAARRLQAIYHLLPAEFKTRKSKEIEAKLADALVLAESLKRASQASFDSGKQLEKKSLDSGPAVAQKLAASGIGTLVTLEAQNQIAQSTIIGLLSQMIAEGESKHAAQISNQAEQMREVGSSLGGMAEALRTGAGGAR